jgi:protein subunit release factor B
VVKCQATRSQSQNAKTARSLLADRVEALEKGDKSRVAIKAEAAKKKKASKVKKTKRKYRELEGKGKNVEVEEEDEVEIIWDDEVAEGSKDCEVADKVETDGKSDVKFAVKSEESGKTV